MGGHVSRTDYDWVYTEEPHKTRRQQILAKYPQVKKLMTHDPWLKYQVLLSLLLQVVAAYLLRDAGWITITLMAYFFGGFINHSMVLAIHEISHNIAFGHKHPKLNRYFGMLANLPMGIPFSVMFKKYHTEHHKYQGDDEMDVDIPSRIEVKLFTNTFTKLIWLIFQGFFYALRPIIVRPKPITHLEVTNFIVQMCFDYLIYHYCGYRSLVYLIGGTFLSLGAHPMAGHFIAEHYVLTKGYETYSYYGILNKLAFNVGYHNEHHDFPNVPGSKLPELKKMAPDFYDDLPHYDSWVKVLYTFVTNPDLGLSSRVKRKAAHAKTVDSDYEDGGGKED